MICPTLKKKNGRVGGMKRKKNDIVTMICSDLYKLQLLKEKNINSLRPHSTNLKFFLVFQHIKLNFKLCLCLQMRRYATFTLTLRIFAREYSNTSEQIYSLYLKKMNANSLYVSSSKSLKDFQTY
jgi:hypothetical protein